MLAPRVGNLMLDISEQRYRARAQCRRFANASFECADISERFPPGVFDLITCSEVLYYLRDVFVLKKLVQQIAQSLKPNSCLLIANANVVNDDRTVTGFDFNEIGAVFIGSVRRGVGLRISEGASAFSRYTEFSCSAASLTEFSEEPSKIRKSPCSDGASDNLLSPRHQVAAAQSPPRSEISLRYNPGSNLHVSSRCIRWTA